MLGGLQQQKLLRQGHQLPGRVRAESLTFVSESRVVFVGDFQIRTRSQWVGVNQIKRMHSHMVSSKPLLFHG